MKIGIISDIHNNVVALDAVLVKLQEAQCEHIICCGDMIGIGPYPEETMQRLMQIPNLIAVLGNHDRCLTDGMPTTVPNAQLMDYEEMEHHKWEHSLLSNESTDFLNRLPCRRDITLGGLQIAVLHYCMDAKNQYIRYTPKPNLNDCQIMFSDIDADVILYGHNHEASLYQDEHSLYVNCGSLGCSAKEGNIALAGILTIDHCEAKYESLKVRYDVGKVVAEIERLAYPSSDVIRKMFF